MKNKRKPISTTQLFRLWYAFWLIICAIIFICDSSVVARVVFGLEIVLCIGCLLALEIERYIARGRK